VSRFDFGTTSGNGRIFSKHLLDGVGVVKLDKLNVANPSFYPMLAEMEFANFQDFRKMAAITFSDVVISHVPFNNGLPFHELVHVEQHRRLGIPRRAELYLEGFLSDGGYDGIQLEVHAYELEARFEASPLHQFLVANKVLD